MEKFSTIRRVVKNRLVYYKDEPDAAFWDAHWAQNLSPAMYKWAENGYLARLIKVRKFLPTEGKIVEAGCGLGQYVMTLRKRGYDAEGVEWGEKTVKAVKEIYPDLPIRIGDVTNLNVPDGYYNGYISFGVMEHDENGPQEFLEEAYRVLGPGGVAFISVPYFHPLRKLKARFGAYQQEAGGIPFYQFVFSKKEFKDFLELYGFEVLNVSCYDSLKGLKDEIPLIQAIVNHTKRKKILVKFLSLMGFLFDRFGHMILFVCRKPGSS